MRKYFKFIFIVIAFAGCKKPYNPPAISLPNNYLVVEGVINSGTDSTFFKLSRTVNLSSKISTKAELHASISVQGDQNASYPLKELGNGKYGAAGLNLDITHKYRLSIKTSNNEQYQSDYVPVVTSPPIDSVSYTAPGTGVNIFVSTHDPKNSTRYYRWDYQETWQFHSAYFSFVKSNGDTILARNLNTDNIYTCWKSDTSSSVIIASSAKLSQDVIFQTPIAFVAASDEKIGIEYSILVRQYALTSDAYNFWLNLKTNTEQLGNIFDAQPSSIPGNIHCITNPAEPVIGYISAGSVATQRIFIFKQQLPLFKTISVYANCPLDTFSYKYFAPGAKAPENQVNEYLNYHKGAIYGLYVPLSGISAMGGPPTGYTATTTGCADCTVRGTNKQPAFWK